MTDNIPAISDIKSLIYKICGSHVMLDRDLAELYCVETRRLNEQVKRNQERFPETFMFQLTKNELEEWMSQIAISNKEKMGLRKMPYAFTEQGVAMLSAVLRSETAVKISIQIIDAFVQMRKFLLENGQLLKRISKIEQKKVHLQVIDQNIDTSTATGRLFFNMLGAIAQFETDIRVERQLDGVMKAKERGVQFGPKKKLTLSDVEELKEKRSKGLLIKDLMKEYGISKVSVYRYLNDYRS